MSEDIQNLLKEFIFHKEETSPSKNKIRESHRIINTLFTNRQDILISYNYPMHLPNPQIGVTKWCIMISRKYTTQTNRNNSIIMCAYNCQRCGDYYKDDIFRYTRKIYPTQIECRCFH